MFFMKMILLLVLLNSQGCLSPDGPEVVAVLEEELFVGADTARRDERHVPRLAVIERLDNQVLLVRRGSVLSMVSVVVGKWSVERGEREREREREKSDHEVVSNS